MEKVETRGGRKRNNPWANKEPTVYLPSIYEVFPAYWILYIAWAM